MVFLDTKKNVWVIKNLEVPVIEDVPMKEMKWFRDKIKWASKGARTMNQRSGN